MGDREGTAIVPGGDNESDAPLSDAFVLDRTENPHPDMLARAHRLRGAANSGDPGPFAALVWATYRLCMCDATGETPKAIEAWMDRNA